MIFLSDGCLLICCISNIPELRNCVLLVPSIRLGPFQQLRDDVSAARSKIPFKEKKGAAGAEEEEEEFPVGAAGGATPKASRAVRRRRRRRRM